MIRSWEGVIRIVPPRTATTFKWRIHFRRCLELRLWQTCAAPRQIRQILQEQLGSWGSLHELRWQDNCPHLLTSFTNTRLFSVYKDTKYVLCDFLTEIAFSFCCASSHASNITTKDIVLPHTYDMQKCQHVSNKQLRNVPSCEHPLIQRISATRLDEWMSNLTFRLCPLRKTGRPPMVILPHFHSNSLSSDKRTVIETLLGGSFTITYIFATSSS